MATSDPVERIAPDQRVEGDKTAGMVREQAIASEGVWAGLVRTDAGAVSAWHHHGDHETTIYVVSGSVRMESGPGGASVFLAAPGDFLHVAKFAIHREANPGDVESHLAVVRAGTGPTTVNVDGPAAS